MQIRDPYGIVQHVGREAAEAFATQVEIENFSTEV